MHDLGTDLYSPNLISVSTKYHNKILFLLNSHLFEFSLLCKAQNHYKLIDHLPFPQYALLPDIFFVSLNLSISNVIPKSGNDNVLCICIASY